MNGMLYKEYKQNSLFILLTALVGVFILPAALFMLSQVNGASLSTTINDYILNKADKGNIVFTIFIGYLATGTAQVLVLVTDSKKVWSLFIASNPDGIRSYIRIKYELIFAMAVLMLISCCTSDRIIGLISQATLNIDVINFTSLYIALFYIQLFLRAIDIPFSLRFGIKKGSAIKLCFFIILFIILIILILANPSGVMDTLAGFAANKKSESKFLTEIVPLLKGIFPFVSAASFLLSYKISCKIYMKGAEQYDK